MLRTLFVDAVEDAALNRYGTTARFKMQDAARFKRAAAATLRRFYVPIFDVRAARCHARCATRAAFTRRHAYTPSETRARDNARTRVLLMRVYTADGRLRNSAAMS